MSEASTQTAPTAARPRPRPRRRFNQVMLWLRRAHLYSGLFLIPWVLVYAISGILFNHASWMSDREWTTLPAGTGRAAAGPLLADDLAGQVLAAINSGTEVATLDPEVPPRLGDARVRVEGATQNHLLRVDPESGEGDVLSRPRVEEQESPFPRKLDLSGRRDYVAQLEANASATVEAAGLEGGEAEADRGPVVRFVARTADERRWQVDYDLTRGTVRSRPYPTTEPTLRRYLIRLHVAHGYPRETTARWLWAVGVDVLGLAFLFWALSGLLMWVQMKKLRKGGLIALGASFVLAGLLFWAMFGAVFG